MLKLYNINVVKKSLNPKVHNFVDHKVVNFLKLLIKSNMNQCNA